jgi:hypothetical protein
VLGEVPAKLEDAVRGVLGVRVEDLGIAMEEDMVMRTRYVYNARKLWWPAAAKEAR